MKPVPDCIPETLNLVLHTARKVSDDPFIHKKVIKKVMGQLANESDLGSSAAELTFDCLMTAYKALGVTDPYEKEKARRNRALQGLEKSFRGYLDVAPDRMAACINLVLAGCMQDSDILGRADAERAILENLDIPVAPDEREGLIRAIDKAESVLFVVDTAGEIALDRLLIEEIARKAAVRAVVARRPVLAMATRADAEAVGLGEVAEVIDPGAAMLGLNLRKASSAFRDIFASADLVIAKGEMHFTALTPVERGIFFVLHAGCGGVAEFFNTGSGSGVVARVAPRPGSGVYDAVSSETAAAQQKRPS